GSTRLIDDLQLSSPVVTPNGDGLNDRLDISFVAFKVENIAPQVRLYDLVGGLVSTLAPTAVAGARYSYTWSGDRADGTIARPGIYLCRIDLDADAGGDAVMRTLSVAY
ncbi:MAG: hypothetical protein QGH25_24735, partial [Candidatus Latescibacteria bacterium]|nr:hypothetical protein [Candidatus Latescibacterota bacterium]